ncbi:serine/threonine-protein kinase VRK1 [Clonorchis sinensis]|uniref:non-specific serine/threonine protein kinase n=1 Tax=Clonorchis sinensis TaxID=79923 RepID=G7YG24_CLOSI|nr:serine/threonine-protein kinase VRK1 [Clonorchis sinensis]
MSFGGVSANSIDLHDEKGPEDIARVNAKKNMGIWLSSNTSFSLRHEKLAEKAFDIPRMIRHTFSRITRIHFQIPYGAYARPLLGYANQVFYSGRTKCVNLIQRVQRAATKMVAGLKSVDYETLFVVLDPLFLEYCRLRGDIIFTYSLFEQRLANRFFTDDPANTPRGLLHIVDRLVETASEQCFLRQSRLSYSTNLTVCSLLLTEEKSPAGKKSPAEGLLSSLIVKATGQRMPFVTQWILVTVNKWIVQNSLKFLGIPRYVSSGLFSPPGKASCRFLIMDRFAGDLESVLKTRKLKTVNVVRAASHVLDALEYLHSRDYAHADIKASNLLYNDSFEQVTLVDFGLVHLFRIGGVHCQQKPDPKFKHNGTLEFCSRDAHTGLPPARRGDLEILLYNLIHWIARCQPGAAQSHSAGLPWGHLISDPKLRQNVPDRIKMDVAALKEKSMQNVGELCAHSGLSSYTELSAFAHEIDRLAYDETPNYRRLHQHLMAICKQTTSTAGARKVGPTGKRSSNESPSAHPGSISALVLPSGGMATRHRKGVTHSAAQLPHIEVFLFVLWLRRMLYLFQANKRTALIELRDVLFGIDTLPTDSGGILHFSELMCHSNSFFIVSWEGTQCRIYHRHGRAIFHEENHTTGLQAISRSSSVDVKSLQKLNHNNAIDVCQCRWKVEASDWKIHCDLSYFTDHRRGLYAQRTHERCKCLTIGVSEALVWSGGNIGLVVLRSVRKIAPRTPTTSPMVTSTTPNAAPTSTSSSRRPLAMSPLVPSPNPVSLRTDRIHDLFPDDDDDMKGLQHRTEISESPRLPKPSGRKVLTPLNTPVDSRSASTPHSSNNRRRSAFCQTSPELLLVAKAEALGRRAAELASRKISLFKRLEADLREDILLACLISSIHRYTDSDSLHHTQQIFIFLAEIIQVTLKVWRDLMSQARYLTRNADAGSVTAMALLDSWLSTLPLGPGHLRSRTVANGLPVDLLPGPSDAASQLLPQQPIHPSAFPLAVARAGGASCGGLCGRTNPYACCLFGRKILATSGQAVNDLSLYTDLETPCDRMEATLLWGHLAPTCPDTLPGYPLLKNDLLLMETSSADSRLSPDYPDIYVAGCQLGEKPSWRRARLSWKDRSLKPSAHKEPRGITATMVELMDDTTGLVFFQFTAFNCKQSCELKRMIPTDGSCYALEIVIIIWSKARKSSHSTELLVFWMIPTAEKFRSANILGVLLVRRFLTRTENFGVDGTRYWLLKTHHKREIKLRLSLEKSIFLVPRFEYGSGVSVSNTDVTLPMMNL